MAKRRPVADTRLARELARQQHPGFDRALDTLPARRTVVAADLTIWSATASKREEPLGRPPTGRPNPIVVGDLVIVSTYHPGRLVAFDRPTGRPRWTLALRSPARGHVYDAPGPGLLYAATVQKLLAIDPATGKARWTFCPYGRKGESLYSSPTVAEGRLFIGDGRGYLHCLDAGRGDSLWRIHTSRAKSNGVNAGPVVEGGVVAVATDAALAFGYDAATGRERWRHRLDGPAGFCRSGGGRTALIWTHRSAYLFSVPDGRLLRRWSVRGHEIRHACAAGELVLVVTRRVSPRDGGRWVVSDLRAFRGATEVYRHAYPRYCRVELRHEPATGKVYETTSHGLGILDPETGTRESVIHLSADGGLNLDQDAAYPPAADAGVLYAMSADGYVFALRHP